MLTFLEQWEAVFGPFRLFRYLTFRSIGAAGTALLLGIVIGPFLIAKLRAMSLSQAQRDSGHHGALKPHTAGKKTTPTMGGVLIVGAVTVSVLLWATPNLWIAAALVAFLGLALIGFLDDWTKVSRRNPKGISARVKLLGQTLVTAAVFGLLASSAEGRAHLRELWVPFLAEPVTLALPLAAAFGLLWLVLAGTSNAINLTDGMDGLAIGCTVTVALAFGIMAYAAGNRVAADYLLISHTPGAGELAVVCAALVGAGLAFLWFNAHPAEVFMGDTGSLALGGVVGCVAFLIHQPFLLVIVGGMFVIEALSVLLQVASFRMTGRRIFRMAPIHHHFQLSGWPESKVVIRFWILSLLCALAGLATLKVR